MSSAPFDRPLKLAVIDGAHAPVFPCRRILGGRMNAETRERSSATDALARMASMDLGLIAMPTVVFSTRVTQCREFGLFLGEQLGNSLPRCLVLLGEQFLTVVFDI